MALISKMARFAMLAILVSACDHLFYHPVEELIYNPERFHFKPEVKIINYEAKAESLKLTAWLFPSAQAKARGLIVHFHGNAQNISSHFLYSAWASREGYEVLIFDYRGYGSSSQKKPSRQGLIEDACAVFSYIDKDPKLSILPVHVLGQSLGGAVAIPALAQCAPKNLSSLTIDSSFSSYRRVAQLKLKGFFLTWPLQYPLSWLVSKGEDPIQFIDTLRVPMLFFHSATDPVVPTLSGQELYLKAPQPKYWVEIPIEGHTLALSGPKSPYRRHYLNFIQSPKGDFSP